jgi:hypothetical protein
MSVPFGSPSVFYPTTLEERIYSVNFHSSEVDTFYDAVRICFDLIFNEKINPYTGIPYLENPVIDHEKSGVNPKSRLAKNYTFSIKHTLDVSNPNALFREHRNRLVSCEFQVVLSYMSRKVRIEHHIGAARISYSLKNMLQGQNMKDILQIYLGTPKNHEYPSILFAEKRIQYIEGKKAIKTFKEVSLPAASMAYHKRLAFSHQQVPWVSQVLGDPSLLEHIGYIGYQDMQQNLMHNVFSTKTHYYNSGSDGSAMLS